MSPYETTADGRQRCPLHDERFEGPSCPRCDALKRAVAIEVVSAPDAVALDSEIAKDVEADIGYAKFLFRISRERLEDDHPNEWRACAGLIAEATKLKYRALEQKEKLSARAHSRYLIEHEKQIKGLTRRKGS